MAADVQLRSDAAPSGLVRTYMSVKERVNGLTVAHVVAYGVTNEVGVLVPQFRRVLTALGHVP